MSPIVSCPCLHSAITPLVALVLLLPAPGVAEPLAAPVALRQPVVDRYHGEDVEDPYRWLEEMDSEDAQAWVRAQDAATRATLEALPERAALLRRMESFRTPEIVSVPQFREQRTFFQTTQLGEDSSRRERIVVEEAGARRVLADTASLAEGSHFATFSGSGTATFQASPDGRYLAYGVRPANSIWTRWHVVEVETGERLDEVVRGISARLATTVYWASDSRGFFYAAFDRPEASENAGDLEHHSLYYHRLGTDSADDELIYRDVDPERTFWPTVTSDGRHLAFVNLSGGDQAVHLLDLEARAQGPRRILDGEGATYSILDQVDDRLWVLAKTVREPGGRILAVDPAGGAPEVVIAEPAHGALVAAAVFGDRLLVQRVAHATPRLDLYDLEGSEIGSVDLPYIGWIRSGLIGARHEARAAFAIQGTADPGAVYTLDLESGRTRLFHQRTDFDTGRYVTRRVFYPGRDGTLVPLFLMHRKGLRLDGRNPVWLYAYGSRWAAAPWYQPQHRLWLELGGIYALAHVRGGGEYGNAWTEAGIGTRKQTGIGDYLRAAEWLVEHGYASPETLIANGGSSSGPLVAAAVNQRPDLFRVALISYPVTDMLRAHVYASPLLSSSFDTPDEPEAYRALRAWSPYQNVSRACYPAVFIAHGDQDRTAVPLHSYKLAAALQHAQTCRRPIRLQIAWGRGHTVGGLPERANQVAFAVRELGLTVPEDW